MTILKLLHMKSFLWSDQKRLLIDIYCLCPNFFIEPFFAEEFVFYKFHEIRLILFNPIAQNLIQLVLHRCFESILILLPLPILWTLFLNQSISHPWYGTPRPSDNLILIKFFTILKLVITVIGNLNLKNHNIAYKICEEITKTSIWLDHGLIYIFATCA